MLWNMSWCTWAPIKLQRLLLHFCGKDISQSLEHWPRSWVAEEPTLKATSSDSFASLWAFGKLGFTLPCSHQWKGGMSSQNADVHDREIRYGPEGRQAKFTWIGACLHCMRSAITRYSLHYFMFECWPCLPIDFYFPMIRSTKKHEHVDHYITKLCEQLWEAFKEAQVQSTSEAERQKWYYNRKANAISLEPGDLVLNKANAYGRRRILKEWWEEELYKVECQVAEGIPFYLMKNQWTGCSWVLHWNQLFSSLLQRWLLSVW